MAYRNAADIIEGLDDAARERHGQANSWQSIPGIGPKTAKVIDQAWSGREPDLLVELRSAAEDLGGGDIRAALRGDLHLHSNWSDGSAPIEEMMATAAALGHEYCALTDHSPRLTIANGLSPDRLRKQLDVIDGLRDAVRADAHPHRDRGRHPRGRQPRPGARAAGASRRRRGQRAFEAVDGFRRDDPPHGARRLQSATPTCSATAPAGWSPGTAASGPNRSSTPRRCSPPAATTARRWRSTPAPNAATRRPGC